MKVLNLYACLGGNRLKWDSIDPNIEVVAVENDPELVRLYSERFPNDKIILGDAHQYLLDNYSSYDYIWSSPPCPTHSRARFWGTGKKNPVYADMSLYQQVILLKNNYEGLYTIENVIPYYEPLIAPSKKSHRHLFWTNFKIPFRLDNSTSFKISDTKDEVKKLCDFHGYDFYKYQGDQRRNKIARNLVHYDLGAMIFERAYNIYARKNPEQEYDLFNQGP